MKISFMEGVYCLCALSIIVLIVYICVSPTPKQIVLNKSDWVCIEEGTKTTVVGKLIYTSKVCTTYTKEK